MAETADAEATVRAFLSRFADRSHGEAAALLADEGRESVVDGFPEGFPREESEPTALLERYRRGLHSQYGAFDGSTT